MREPLPNDRYKDSHGSLVTIDIVAFNRVTFSRDGYSSPCIMPLARFVAEFTFIGRA
ncbi:DUF4222 domain-containing protein [Yersinia enterocolitica]|uniref:DUF4222 domain-containing protein n=1 Tax=Yersinia TaxID=629 RepID=UPI00110E1D02|nr:MULTISPECIES: DUF4222 domain-containing protein [Yersinia]QDW34301.1 DUF4222 domain-containing protein [Yersinia sp. KBS0713]HDM8083491.1 DUF4222 domain-containing protein [Yersinia enterocolitica]